MNAAEKAAVKNMIYKKRLIELRENKDLKQYDIANILNIYKGLYNQYETEYEIIPIKHLNTLSNYFNVSIDYLFNLTSQLNYKNSKETIDSIIVGNRLKEFRKEQKLTQEKLANILNMARSALANYERGRNIIATPFLYTICKKYHISADYLLGKTDSPVYLI